MITPSLLAAWMRIELTDHREQTVSPRRHGVPRPSVPRQPTWEEGRWSAALGRLEETRTSTEAVFVPAQRRRNPTGTRRLVD